MGYQHRRIKATCGHCKSRTVFWSWEEWKQQLKLYPVPPEDSGEEWAQLYSIRSFVRQASRRLPGCLFNTTKTGTVMGETVFSDRCRDTEIESWQYPSRSCHLVAGLTNGAETCDLWESIKALCQTEVERRFLHWYL
ncbi:MAG: hypothetical protein L0312_17585, partial [Acidobacteria bacterium]|nr:hypothetical protein [Acidobacteriota bacterium]